MLFLKSKQKKYLNDAKRVAKAVLELEKEYEKLTNEELNKKTTYFLDKIKNGATKEDIMVEAFAAAREAGRRTIGLKAYEVQIIGATLISKGYIAEMQTGEGKTLTEIMPAYLMSLFKDGVHIVTVNDYLAKRDCEWMKPVYDMLGVSCSYVIGKSTKEDRKYGYSCDITYVTNNELAFDYLRDNMVTNTKDIVLNGRFGFAIIDEADSILIDEARTPFIISSKSSERASLISIADKLVRTLKRGEDLKELGKMDYLTGNTDVEKDKNCDYRVDVKNKNIILTKNGTLKIEKAFGCGFLSDPANSEILYCVMTSLKAHNLMKDMQDYIVKDGEVLCVDSFTGRVQKGRRFTAGLHQAIEAKENVEIKPETITTATVTFQTLFNMYKAKAGMTGTALTEAKELMEIYKLIPIAVPTNVPTKREDLPDAVYRTCEERDEAVVKLIEEEHEKGRAILVGTPSVEAAERISESLIRKNIPHNVLSAKNDELEAEIVAKAGEKGAITVATNMAGRGTDIKLCDECKEKGLLVIGTSRHDSRRIDNQLRGRAGRQGDAGETIFMLSTEDELIKLFGGDMIRNLVDTIKVPYGEPLTHPLLTKNIELAQKAVEGINFETRKKLYEYDTIIAGQCSIIYGLRESALKNGITKEIPDTIADTIDKLINDNLIDEESINTEKLYETLNIYNKNKYFDFDKDLKQREKESVIDYANRLCETITKQWDKRKEEFLNEEEWEEFNSIVFLKTLDKYWGNHINAMTELRKNIHLQSYAQKDPLIEYKKEGGDMFIQLLEDFKMEVTSSLLVSKIIRMEKSIENNSNEENIEEN